MAEIIKTYKQEVPAMRFICKIDPGKGRGWGEWHCNGWFDLIEEASGGASENVKLYEDGGAYIGLLYMNSESKLTEYRIGMFAPAGTPVPEGFEAIDYPAQNFGICWIYGANMGDIMKEAKNAADKLAEAEMEIIRDEDGSHRRLERYCCPRFTTPDDKGNIIVDYCYFVK